jgi:hypothetical protein
VRRKFGVLFQDGALFGSMNLFDNIAFPLREHTKKSDREIRDIVLEGGKTLEVLSGRAGEIGPLLVGVREYLQFQAIVDHIPYANGSKMGAVKLIAGGGSPCGQGAPCPAPGTSGPTSPAPALPQLPALPVNLLPQLQSGAKAVTSLIQGVLG